jgi:hypothetical protein
LIGLPEWTEQLQKRGLDPLGMQNAGVALYQQLLPGISNVTLRMRYYGLYCWLSDAYARLSGSTDPDEWRRWVRRCEAVYALAASHADNEAGVAGVEWAAEVLKDTDGEVDFADATLTTGQRLYLRQPMGVFGGAYSSQLVEMGLMKAGADHTILVRTPELGLSAARAFSREIGPDAETLLTDTIKDATIGRKGLEELFTALPSALDPERDEAELYREVLFGERGDEKGRSRRASLLLILRIARHLSARPAPDEVRWILFEGTLQHLPPNLEAQRVRWEAYQAHDLLQLAFAGLLRWALDRLGEREAELDLTGLAAVSLSDLAAAQCLPQVSSWSDWIEANRDQPDYRSAAQALGRTAPSGVIGADSIRGSLAIIAGLQARAAVRLDLQNEILDSFPISEFARSIRTEFAFLDGWAGRPVRDVVSTLLTDRILRRHIWVAMQKFRRRDYTFLFEANDGLLRLRSKYSPVLTTPRLGPAITFLEDVGLLDEQGVTARGAALLEADA